MKEGLCGGDILTVSSRCRDKKSGDDGGDVRAGLFGGKRGDESGVVGASIGVSGGESMMGGADGGQKGITGDAIPGVGA